MEHNILVEIFNIFFNLNGCSDDDDCDDECGGGTSPLAQEVAEAASTIEAYIEEEVESSKVPPKPVITLLGDANVTHEAGTSYRDAGATATDHAGEDLTSDISTMGTVNTSKVGTYTLRYNVRDFDGRNAKEVTRTVNVVDTVAPVITLIGDEIVGLEVGAVFTDPGASATDAVDGSRTAYIVVTGTVDTSKVGTYTLRYNVSDAAYNAATEVTRTVNVVDTVAPVITLIGDEIVELEVGAVFTDPGASATDAVDGSRTAYIVVTGTVDTSKVGTYTLRYNVSDAAYNAATEVTRTVNVVAPVDTAPNVEPLVTDRHVEIYTSNAGKNYYLFNNNEEYDINKKFSVEAETVIKLLDVPQSHPIAIVEIKDDQGNIYNPLNPQGQEPPLLYGTDGDVRKVVVNGVNYYWGDVNLFARFFFGGASVKCRHHGYMGGKDLLVPV